MGIIAYILKNPFVQWVIVFVVALAATAVAIYSYGNGREEEGRRLEAVVWADRYSDLENAKTVAESSLTVRLSQPPEIRIHYRDRGTGGNVVAIDSAFQAGWEKGFESLYGQYLDMAYTAEYPLDTVQLTPDSLEIRTTGRFIYDPPSRMWDIWFQPSPVITREWLIRLGYILPPQVIEYDWAAELMLGKSKSVRVSPSLWYDIYGVGIDLEPRHAPVWKAGVRLEW